MTGRLRRARAGLLFLALCASLGAPAARALQLPVGSGNWTSGVAATTGTAPTLLIPAPATAGNALYLASGNCINSGTSTSVVQLENGSGGPVLGYAIAPAGFGHQWLFTPPLALSPKTALYFAPLTGSTTIYCTASAYIGAP